MNGSVAAGPLELLPNLGAEEGDDWRAYREQPSVRSAARLWALLFGANARLRSPGDQEVWSARGRDSLWPRALGSPPDSPVFSWLADATGPLAWLNTPSLAADADSRMGRPLWGAPPSAARAVHDKAFAAEAAKTLGLAPRSLAPLIEVLDPDELRDADTLLPRLDRTLAEWPAWTEHRFTLKPRFGSSGRGRVGGRDRVDGDSVRGALPRLAERGGAIFEPWLDRTRDLSVCLRIPGPEEPDSLPTILGSLEMWSTPSGVYRGHCGEVDSRGRIFSGDREDETLRADAAAVCSLARDRGYFGPCGVDSFRYREGGESPQGGTERLRGAVEFNARPTMGLVTIGLVRRALAIVREPLALTPGDRRGFALTYHDPTDTQWRERLQRGLGDDALLLDLAAGDDPADPRPVLAFTPDPDTLRAARRDVFDC